VSAIVLHAGKLVRAPASATAHGATLVQANIPILDSDVWSLDYLVQNLNSLQALSVRPRTRSGTPGLIVWPESPAPFWTTDLHLRATLANIARATNSYIIAGSIGIDHTGDPTASRYLQFRVGHCATGAWTERYNKIHLVLSASTSLSQSCSVRQRAYPADWNFCAGQVARAAGCGDTKAGVFICYESIFPDEVRQFAKNALRYL